TFIVRLLQSGLIDADNLPHKYQHELHANEILLLAYYIAGVNIESAYREALSETGCEEAYKPFGGIVLTDTFQLSEEGDPMDEVFFPRNNARAERQRDLDIRVILGNPPWSRGQGSQSDMNPNQSYPTLDRSIEATYAAPSQSGGKAPVYDSYVRGIRWASNRVRDSEDGGIVAFVTNGSFIDRGSFDGFRKAVTSEFHEVYVYNLRGAAHGSGEMRKREKGNVFGGGTRTAVAILLLVKRGGAVTRPSVVRYKDIGDYLTRGQKLEVVADSDLGEMDWHDVSPNEAGDWINQRSKRFLSFRPLAQVRGQPTGTATPIFGFSTLGIVSNRDAWVYGSSKAVLRSQIERTVAFFNEQVAGFVPPPGSAADRLSAAKLYAKRDDSRFRWAESSEQRLSRKQEIEIEASGYRVASYRPFFRQHLYMDQALNHRTYRMPRVFPVGVERAVGIAVANRVAGDSMGVLAVDAITALHFPGSDGQFFPRYLPPEEGTATPQGALLKGEAKIDDNIHSDALAAYRRCLGPDVTPDQVFAYTYGVLHSREYCERYAADLARLLPRIPDPADRAMFDAFAEAGQRLLDLHIGYEGVEPYPLDEHVLDGAPPGPERYRVEKMRWGGQARNPDLSRIIYNDWVTLAGIPDEAHDYMVGPRSALAWLIDRYQVSTDRASGIVNDVNDWGLERDEPRYILDLVKRIVTVSVETMCIVRGLPELREAD
ncbi:MAG: damage-inducible protein, partial [Chloroflexi bacterium]|nr:damage-inducible protein [Chloroflexota bacterium]